jgi:hypothetical protein
MPAPTAIASTPKWENDLSRVEAPAPAAPTEVIFRAGVSAANKGAKGDWIGAGTDLALGLYAAFTQKLPPPGDRCRYNLNPLGLDVKGSDRGLDKLMWGGTGNRWIDGHPNAGVNQDNAPFELSMKKIRGRFAEPLSKHWPVAGEQDDASRAPCSANAGISEAAYFTLAGWRQRVNDYSFDRECHQTKYKDTLSHDAIGTPQELRRCNAAQIMASWAILTSEQFRDRWRGAVSSAISDALSVKDTPEIRSELESFYGGRFLDAGWVWETRKVDGIPAGQWPRWIPLDTAAKPLRNIYAEAWRLGLDNHTIGRLAGLSPLAGLGPWSTLSKADKTRAVAAGYVIAAAKAKGSMQAFETGRRIVSGACPECAVGQTDIRAALQRLSVGVQQEALAGVDEAILKPGNSRAQEKAPITAGAVVASLLLPGIAILGGVYIAKKLKRGRRKKHGIKR